MTIHEIWELYPETEKMDWTANGDAWIHKDATVSRRADIKGRAIIRSGHIACDAIVSGDAIISGKAVITGNARVSGNARVYDYTRVDHYAAVSGNARVSGNAKVYGNAWISGDAWLSGKAFVSGKAKVHGGAHKIPPLYIQGTGDFLCYSAPGQITSGWDTNTIIWWLANVEQWARTNNYTVDQQKEYRRHIEYMAEWIKRFGLFGLIPIRDDER